MQCLVIESVLLSHSGAVELLPPVELLPWSSKLESSSGQQKKTVSSSNPLQQTGPQYEEVLELKQNRAYEPSQTSIEMRPNEAYGPMQHWFATDV